jgi:hypothetical protein
MLVTREQGRSTAVLVEAFGPAQKIIVSCTTLRYASLGLPLSGLAFIGGP